MVIPGFTLENVLKIYLYIALFATVLFVLKLIIFSIFGGDSEVHADFNSEVDTDASFNFISIQSILAFLMGFGWMGYTCIRQIGIESQMISFVISFAVGFGFMALNAYLMFLVKKLEKKVVRDKNTAIGHVGKAYTAFAPNSAGQIEVEICGKLSVENAMNATDEEISSFDQVKVVKVVDDLLYIEKVK